MSTLFNELVLGFPSSRKTLTLYDVCECVGGNGSLCKRMDNRQGEKREGAVRIRGWEIEYAYSHSP